MKFATIGAVVASSCLDLGLALTETFVRSAIVNKRGDIKLSEAAADNATAHPRDNKYRLCRVGKKAKCLSKSECQEVATLRGKTFQVLDHSLTQRPCGCFRDSSSCCKKYVFWNPDPVGGHYSGYYRQYRRKHQKAWKVSLAEEGTDDVVPTLPEGSEQAIIDAQGEMIHEQDPDEVEEGETEDPDETEEADKEADEDEPGDGDEQEGEALIEGDTEAKGCKHPSSKRCQRKCGGDIIAYCNSYEDLKKEFCGGESCGVAQYQSCRKHFRDHGNKEIKTGKRPAPSCPGKAAFTREPGFCRSAAGKSGGWCHCGVKRSAAACWREAERMSSAVAADYYRDDVNCPECSSGKMPRGSCLLFTLSAGPPTDCPSGCPSASHNSQSDTVDVESYDGDGKAAGMCLLPAQA